MEVDYLIGGVGVAESYSGESGWGSLQASMPVTQF